MIIDEQILETAAIFGEPAELWQGQIVFNKHSLLAYTRRIIALAQQIKPLEWWDKPEAMYAATDCSSYRIGKETKSVKRYDDDGSDTYIGLFATQAEAIEAANEDYRKRVLSCLVNGGE